MIQRGGGAGFLLEAAKAIRVGSEPGSTILMATSRPSRGSRAR